MNERNYQYVVVEIQTNTDGTIGALVTPKADYYEAESTYHTVLAAAALSALPVHTAVLLDNQGGVLHAQAFVKEQEEQADVQ